METRRGGYFFNSCVLDLYALRPVVVLLAEVSSSSLDVSSAELSEDIRGNSTVSSFLVAFFLGLSFFPATLTSSVETYKAHRSLTTA